MQLTILEVLYLVLIIAILLFTIFFIVFIIEATKVMKDVRKITDRGEQLVSTLTEIPMNIANRILEKMRGRKKDHDKKEE